MAVIPIVCTNCGEKYKLPDTFRSDKAKCKKCGAVIDVKSQLPRQEPSAAAEPSVEPERSAIKQPAAAPAREQDPEPIKPRAERKPEPARAKPRAAAAEPAAAKARPASAKPAAAGVSPKAKPAGAKAAAKAAAGAEPRRARGMDRRASASDEDSGERPGRGRGRGARSSGRGERDTAKKSNAALLIGGGIGLAGVVVVALIFLLGGNDNAGEAAAAARNAAPELTLQPVADPPASGGDGAPGAAAIDDAAAKAAEAAPAAGGEAAQPTEPEPQPSKPGPDGPTSRDEVFDPKSLDPLEYPAEISEADGAKITNLVADVIDGGMGAGSAKNELRDLGWAAAIGIVNGLRELDYHDPFGAMSGFELNRLLEQMTHGYNFGYRAPLDYSAEITLKDADWNSKTVKAWQALLRRFPSKEKWDEEMKKRAAQKAK